MSTESFEEWYEKAGAIVFVDEYKDAMQEAFKAGEARKKAQIIRMIADLRGRSPSMQKLYHAIEELE